MSSERHCAYAFSKTGYELKDQANKKQGMDLILLLILSSVSFTPDLKGLDESEKRGVTVVVFPHLIEFQRVQ